MERVSVRRTIIRAGPIHTDNDHIPRRRPLSSIVLFVAVLLSSSAMGLRSLLSFGLFILPVAITVGVLVGVEQYRLGHHERNPLGPDNDIITTTTYCQRSYGYSPAPWRYTCKFPCSSCKTRKRVFWIWCSTDSCFCAGWREQGRGRDTDWWPRCNQDPCPSQNARPVKANRGG